MTDYQAFIEAKVAQAKTWGFDVDPRELNTMLKDHTRAMVRWALAGGRRALFAAFGLHKTAAQLEIMRLVGLRAPGRARLITLPLGVRQEFARDATNLFRDEYSIRHKFIRRAEEADDHAAIYLTNYESVREGILDVAALDPIAVSLDEAAILRGFGGTKTFREAMALFAGDDRRDRAQRVQTDGVPFRFVATATPSPNEFIEILAYAAFLGVMDIGQAKTRFFKRNSEKADELTLHEHKIEEFWTWVASWALFVQRPSDICTCNEKTWSGSGSGSSSSSVGTMEDGSAAATAAASGDPTVTTSRRDETPAAGAPATGMAAKAPQPMASGAASSSDAEIPSTRTGPSTAAAGSPSASGGASSETSSPTWGSPSPAQPSSGSTMPAATSRATADGRAAESRPRTPAATSTSRTTGEPNRSPRGPANSASASGVSTPDTSSAGPRIGFSRCRCDEGYALPRLEVLWHELASDHREAGQEKDGQARLFKNAAIGVTEASREKRASMAARVAQVASLIAAGDGSQWVVWCDLNDEQAAIERALDAAGVSYSSLYGHQDLEERERLLAAWRAGDTLVFISKPVMYGAGINMQQAHQMVFAGISYKFADVIQASHRIHRFGQQHPCTVHFIYTEAEQEIRGDLERKWRQHEETVARMTAIIREYGLAQASMAGILQRSIGCERQEARGAAWVMVRNDCVLETSAMEPDSVGLVVTSIPFSHQYEYSPSYNDFGHTDNNEHFWRQMDFLTPELLRVVQPGRVVAVHVKDRITPGGINGFGFQTVTRISDQCADHFERHGFAFLGRKTIVTDVVRENNQTYRLGWTEQCKDGSRMGAGLPEYVMLFRKPPTDRSNGYADLPVVKDKAEYTRARWQYDAHGFTRSSGNRLLAPEDLDGLTQEQIYKRFRKYSIENVYDFERDLAIAEHVDRSGWLPSTFMLLPPASWHPDVWTDVARMRTLNADQAAKGREMHLCPLQFDIVDRLITQFSMPGELVFDPFAGLGTVPLRALRLRRRGLGVELNAAYFADACWYLQAEERKAATPSLFDLDGIEAAA